MVYTKYFSIVRSRPLFTNSGIHLYPESTTLITERANWGTAKTRKHTEWYMLLNLPHV